MTEAIIAEQQKEISPFTFTSDGTKVFDLDNLMIKVKEIDENTFRSYIHDGQNDFSNWIRDSLELHELADFVEQIDNKDEFVTIIGSFLQNKSDQKEAPDYKEEKIKTVVSDSNYKPQSRKEMVSEGVLSTVKATVHKQIVNQMQSEISKVVIGQEEAIRTVIISLISNAHALLEGVPGLAKSLLVESFSRVISGTTFRRIQFVPDMLPSDILGGEIYNPKTSEFNTVKGPIFANFILADEINRAPPKTHAALMECMQEKKVNIGKDEFILDKPFLVQATMNPLENKGTYELPEAILDRFMFKIDLDYPDRESEMKIITENATVKRIAIDKNLNYKIIKEKILEIQKDVKRVYLSEPVKEFILNIILATRGLNESIEGRRFIKYGGGPRAAIYLGLGSQAVALTHGRNYVIPEDVIYVCKPILRHRLALNFKGKAHAISTDKIIDEILSKIDAV